MTKGQAQNQLGQLFVDIGVGGLGQTLKALNSVSASFLLTKNAATQAIKPFIDMGKQAANSAVGIGKMAAALGTTTLNAQKLQYYLKQHKSEGLESDVAKLQGIYADYQQRIGGIPMQFATALRRVGLDWQNYSGSFEDTIKLIQDVKNSDKFKSFSDIEQLSILKQLGLSGNWRYLFEKDDFNLDAILAVTKEDIDKEIELSEAMEKLRNSLDQLKQKVVTALIDSGAIDKLGIIIDKLDNITGGKATPDDRKTVKKVIHGSAIVGGGTAGAALLSPLGPVGAGVGFIGGATAAYLKTEKEIKARESKAYLTPTAMGKPSDVPTRDLTPQGVYIKQDINVKAPDGYEITQDRYIKMLNNLPLITETDFNNSVNRNGRPQK